MFQLGAATLKYHPESISVWLEQNSLFCGCEEEGQGIKNYLFSQCSLHMYHIHALIPSLQKALSLPMEPASWPDTTNQAETCRKVEKAAPEYRNSGVGRDFKDHPVAAPLPLLYQALGLVAQGHIQPWS